MIIRIWNILLHECFIQKRFVFELFLALIIPVLLSSCSSSHSSSGNTNLNPNLVSQNNLGQNATVKPFQTVALNLASLSDNHLSNSPDAGYHQFPYEILNAGKYKYCIPDDDPYVTIIEMFDQSSNLVGRWVKGEVCSSAPLEAGNYTMHVHLNGSSSQPVIFMKPHDVTVTPTGTTKASAKSVASIDNSQIPINQFMNIKVNSLSDILQRNSIKNLQQGWGVLTTFPSDNKSAYPVIRQPQTHYSFNTSFCDNTSGPTLSSRAIDASKQPTLDNLFYFKQNLENATLSISQGAIPVIIYGSISFDECFRAYCYQCGGCYYSCNAIQLLGPDYGGGVPANFSFITSTGMNFNLQALGKFIGWVSNDMSSFTGGFKEGLAWGTSNAYPVNFNVSVRYGTTSGYNFPAIMANEVILLDQIFSAAGFPENTHYWIINGSMQDFSTFSFDNPTNRIRTVIAGRGVRAQVFQYPSYQGDSLYVSPPVDSEMAMTGTDNALLDNAAVGSVRIEPNTNDIPVNEYEYNIIVSANTCIGCDLRGFNASFSTVKSINNADFSSSDLSYSNWNNTNISNSKFQNVNFTGAKFTNHTFDSCNFNRTDFTKAVFSNSKFVYNSTIKAENLFYNACPKFEYMDLTSSDGTSLGLDSYFAVGTGSGYNAEQWWSTQSSRCRTSIAYSKLTQNLFQDKRLWQFVDARGVDFSNMNFDGAYFTGSNLSNAIFKNASLKGAVFVKAILTGADLTGADLTGAHMEGAVLSGADLYKIKTLSNAYLSGIVLDKPNFSDLDMSGAQMQARSYTNWDGHTFDKFLPASVIGAYMYNTKLNSANLSGAYFQNVSWYGTGATGEKATMEGTHFEKADMPGLNLKQAHLKHANFTDAVLVNADLSTSNSTDYSFEDTTFYQANLRGANLSGANLNKAILYSAYIYAGSDSLTTTLEILDDPTRVPNQYKYYAVSYHATMPPASTDGIVTCPNGVVSASGNCGDISSDYWKACTPPRDPTDCYLRKALPGEQADDKGMVIQCSSQRHPVTP
jgi:uncharacterized protein YjbI with pentapeptide repeats